MVEKANGVQPMDAIRKADQASAKAAPTASGQPISITGDFKEQGSKQWQISQ
jgi:hypothetical protein